VINGIGIGLAMTVMGGVAVLMVPILFLFYKYGENIRERSPYLNPKAERPIV
jgi:DHA1 family multidrug resistance protein-like MFS transporter